MKVETMIKLKSKHYTEYRHFTIMLSTADEDDYDEDDYDEDPHNTLNIAFFNRSYWFKIPQIIKPREKWIDLSQYDWSKNRNGQRGYFERIKKQFGFSADAEAFHIRYGIQPMCWSKDDPENSDHSKCYFYPWRHEIVRHDLLLPNGDLYVRNMFRFGRRKGCHLHWYDVFNATYGNATTEVAKYVNLTHVTKNGDTQTARIRLTGEEREWRRWWGLLPFGKIVNRTCECSSDVELGERAGSWKGGLMGWGCEWKKGETLEQAFQRWYSSWNGDR